MSKTTIRPIRSTLPKRRFDHFRQAQRLLVLTELLKSVHAVDAGENCEDDNRNNHEDAQVRRSAVLDSKSKGKRPDQHSRDEKSEQSNDESSTHVRPSPARDDGDSDKVESRKHHHQGGKQCNQKCIHRNSFRSRV